MNIDQLSYFTIVADEGSLHKAADRLFLTHQSLSRSLRALEEELGTQLLNRSKRGVSLTSDGKKIYYMAKRILNDIRTTKETLSIYTSLQSDLTVSSVIGMNPLFLTLIQKFKEKFPTISLKVNNSGSTHALEQLKEHKTDIVYCLLEKDQVEQLPSNFKVLEIFQDSLNVLLPMSHPLSKYEAVRIKDIVSYPLVLYGRDTDEVIDSPFSGFKDINPDEINISLVSDNRKVHFKTIASGAGVGFISSSIINSIDIIAELQDLGLTTRPILERIDKKVYSITTIESFEKKGDLITQFENLFSENMRLKQIEIYL